MSFNLLDEIRFRVKEDALELWTDASGVEFDLSEPNVEAHGDLSVNIAMVLAKKLKKSPEHVAREYIEYIKERNWFQDYIMRVEVMKPGFINFFLKPDFLYGHLQGFVQQLKELPELREKIVIEHTNVNPNKAMHIGHLRNAILGDAIRRVLDRSGYKTEVQYYVDDTGMQVADSYLGLQELAIQQEKNEKFDHYLWRVYAAVHKEYESNPDLLSKRTHILREIENPASKTASAVKALAQTVLQDHLRTAWNFKISYDLLVWESDILGFGFWKETFEILKRSQSFALEKEGKNAGCWVIKAGDEPSAEEYSADKILVKSDGTVTYTGKDIAYHLWKFNVLGKDFRYLTWRDAPQDRALASTDRSGTASASFGRAGRVYNVIDVRQTYTQAMVKRALEELGFTNQAESLRHVSYGFVSLSAKTAATLQSGRARRLMSGRSGIGVKADDVLTAVEDHVRRQEHRVHSDREREAVASRDIAIGAIKYFMLRYNPHTEIVFDYDEALSLDGNTGPYIQYAYARAESILDKGEVTIMPHVDARDVTSEETQVLKKIYLWPEVLRLTADDLNINRITSFAFDLANSFNTFYEAQPVLKAEAGVRAQRLALVYVFRTVLADALAVLGITAPQKM